MADRKLADILSKGADKWNRWRQTEDLELQWHKRHPSLGRLDLRDAHIRYADLRGADLTDADLRGVDFTGADLGDVNLRGADLRGADFSDADLRGADFRGADVTGAVADFTIFGDLDLRTVRGLDTIRHLGPSTIGVDTIYRSNGQIPEIFLRGTGVPDAFIAFARSLVDQPIQFHSCFISYSTKDQDFADRLYADLQSKGIRCWFAPHDVQGGRKLHEQIDEAIRVYDRLLLILSQHSIDSEWVKTEIAKARKRELREKRQMLFPLRLVDFDTLREWECFDEYSGKDAAREIREYFIPDFSDWKDHDPYQKAFASLIRDLEDKARRTP